MLHAGSLLLPWAWGAVCPTVASAPAVLTGDRLDNRQAGHREGEEKEEEETTLGAVSITETQRMVYVPEMQEDARPRTYKYHGMGIIHGPLWQALFGCIQVGCVGWGVTECSAGGGPPSSFRGG